MEHQSIGLSALAFSIRSAFLLHAARGLLAKGYALLFRASPKVKSRAVMGQSPIPQGYGRVCAELSAGRSGSGCFGAIAPFIDGASERWPHTIQRSAKHLFPLEGCFETCWPIWRVAGYFSFCIAAMHISMAPHSKLSIPLVDAMIIAYKDKRSLLLLLALRRSAAAPCFNALSGVRSFASGYAVRTL